MDPLTPEKRSALMSRIRGKHTKPEVAVRSILHALGLRFRLHDRRLPGTPDIVLARHRTVVQVHGCFWHRHGCRYTTDPKTRPDFWAAKFAANQARDARTNAALEALGWRVLTVWECDLKDPDSLRKRLEDTFSRKRASQRSTTRQSPRKLAVR